MYFSFCLYHSFATTPLVAEVLLYVAPQKHINSIRLVCKTPSSETKLILLLLYMYTQAIHSCMKILGGVTVQM